MANERQRWEEKKMTEERERGFGRSGSVESSVLRLDRIPADIASLYVT